MQEDTGQRSQQLSNTRSDQSVELGGKNESCWCLGLPAPITFAGKSKSMIDRISSFANYRKIN